MNLLLIKEYILIIINILEKIEKYSYYSNNLIIEIS
jgi:hypothetical protein